VNLPKAQTRGTEDDARITITLGKNGEMALDENMISSESLLALLKTRLDGNQKELLVVIRADEGTPYHVVQRVLASARTAGAKRLAIATRQKVKVHL
jgi:biopolymer transport protein ExbD